MPLLLGHARPNPVVGGTFWLRHANVVLLIAAVALAGLRLTARARTPPGR